VSSRANPSTSTRAKSKAAAGKRCRNASGWMQREKSLTRSIGCLRARAPMPVAVPTAHLATIAIANLAHLATGASAPIAPNMDGRGIPGGKRPKGIRAGMTSNAGTANNAGIAGITHRDGAIIHKGTGSALIRPISGGADVTTELLLQDDFPA